MVGNKIKKVIAQSYYFYIGQENEAKLDIKH
jgi:hypothetical protein